MKKKVPVVVYQDGKRNEIGEAEVDIWPGEVRVSGMLFTGVIPITESFGFSPETPKDASAQ